MIVLGWILDRSLVPVLGSWLSIWCTRSVATTSCRPRWWYWLPVLVLIQEFLCVLLSLVHVVISTCRCSALRWKRSKGILLPMHVLHLWLSLRFFGFLILYQSLLCCLPFPFLPVLISLLLQSIDLSFWLKHILLVQNSMTEFRLKYGLTQEVLGPSLHHWHLQDLVDVRP